MTVGFQSLGLGLVHRFFAKLEFEEAQGFVPGGFLLRAVASSSAPSRRAMVRRGDPGDVVGGDRTLQKPERNRET